METAEILVVEKKGMLYRVREIDSGICNMLRELLWYNLTLKEYAASLGSAEEVYKKICSSIDSWTSVFVASSTVNDLLDVLVMAQEHTKVMEKLKTAEEIRAYKQEYGPLKFSEEITVFHGIRKGTAHWKRKIQTRKASLVEPTAPIPTGESLTEKPTLA